MSNQGVSLIAPTLLAVATAALAVGALVFLQPVDGGERAASEAEMSSARAALQVALSSAQSTASQASPEAAKPLVDATQRCAELLDSGELAELRACETEILTLTAEVGQGL